MKWFKHHTDNHTGRAIQQGLNKFGWQAYSIYFLMEICAQKLDRPNADELLPSDCVFVFDRLLVCSLMRAKMPTVVSLLTHYQLHGWLEFSANDLEIEIKMPMLLDLLDRRFKKVSCKRLDSVTEVSLEKRREEKIERREEKSILSEAEISVPSIKTKKLKVDLIGEQKIEVDPKLVESWVDTYPKDFLELEFKKAKSWVLANRHKAPKSNWGRFLNNWFSRGWDNYRKTLKSEQVKPTFEEIVELLK